MNKLFLILICALFLAASCQQKADPLPASDSKAFEKASAYYTSNPDSAFFYFNKVVNESPDSQQVAAAFTNMAMLQSDAGDYFGAEESLTQSLRFWGDKGRSALATTYNELGMASAKLKNYEEAISFYDRALAYQTDSSLRPALLNNQANAYQKQKSYEQAIRRYQEALHFPKVKPKTYARVQTNLAITKWLQDSSYRAAPELLKSLQARRQLADVWGENSSYANLTKYYFRSRPDSALFYAGCMLQTAKRLNSPDDQLEALQTLIKLSPALDAKQYFLRYETLSDSMSTVRNAAKNQFALIRYQAQKHKADNLKLQKENSEKRYELALQQVISLCAVCLLIGGSLAGFYLHRKRQERLRLETEKRIQDNELKLSKKVHDVVANGLYQVMTRIEHQNQLDRDQLLDDIDQLYEQSRDISYNKQAKQAGPVHEEFSELLSSYASDRTQIIIIGNQETTWYGAKPMLCDELYYVLRELMINMNKHSHATRVVVRFERELDQLQIHYTDNGTGISDEVSWGNGLKSTGNRIRDLNGQITFGTGRTDGLEVRISLPLA